MTVDLPGLFDLQVNGFGRIDFNGPGLTADRVDEALRKIRDTGVTRCLPTLITSSFEDLPARVRLLSRTPSPALAQIHMEEPYLSPDDGAAGIGRRGPGRP